MPRATFGMFGTMSGLLLALSGCAMGSVDTPPDTGGSPGADVVAIDAPLGRPDVPATADARADARADAVVAMDVPQDRAVMPADVVVARDVVTAPDVPMTRDVVVAMDVPGSTCPSTCAGNSDCQNFCPAAPAGSINCCLPGAGGGTCYINSGSSCPGGGTDAGGGTDTGLPFGGGPGAFCTADSQCNSGADCCTAILSCGCSIPFFGCLPC